MAPKKPGVNGKKGKKNGIKQSTSSLHVAQTPSHLPSTYMAATDVYGSGMYSPLIGCCDGQYSQ
jgi:hypothetical protein